MSNTPKKASQWSHELINPPQTYPSRLVKPIDVIHHRLKREAGKGGILEGLQVINTPIMRIEGADQLPNICMVEYSDIETPWLGAKTQSKMSTNQVKVESTASFLLSFEKENGNYSMPLNQKPWGMLNWLERFKDTLETDDAGDIDATLEMSCIEPFYCHVRESEVMDLSWSFLIDVELFPVPIQRGTRRYGWKITEATEAKVVFPN